MRALQLKINEAIRKALFPSLEQFVPENLRDDERVDASDREVFSGVRSAVSEVLTTSAITAQAATVAQRVQRHSAAEFARIGITLEDEPPLARLIARWRRDLVNTVKSVESDQLDRLERILRDNRGLRVEALRDKLDERLDLGIKAAERLARNHVVMLSAGVNHERMEAAGITEAIWTTAGNEKVSDAHDALEGHRYKLGEPVTDADGNVGFPGTIRPNCQCQEYPVIPALED
jgi:hypothetical protein